MEDVESYVQDQFPPPGPVDGAEGPDGAGDRQAPSSTTSISVRTRPLISKVDAPADGLDQTNLGYITQLAGKTDVPVYLGLIPSAAEICGTSCHPARSPGTRTDISNKRRRRAFP